MERTSESGPFLAASTFPGVKKLGARQSIAPVSPLAVDVLVACAPPQHRQSATGFETPQDGEPT